MGIVLCKLKYKIYLSEGIMQFGIFQVEEETCATCTWALKGTWSTLQLPLCFLEVAALTTFTPQVSAVLASQILQIQRQHCSLLQGKTARSFWWMNLNHSYHRLDFILNTVHIIKQPGIKLVSFPLPGSFYFLPLCMFAEATLILFVESYIHVETSSICTTYLIGKLLCRISQ